MRQIYGVDLAKEKFDVNFLNSNNVSKSIIVKNDLNGIVAFLNKLPNDCIICAEHTGVYSDLLLYLSGCMNIQVALVSGYEIKHSLGLLKGKSDKIDAKRIREYGERFYDRA
jgi:transposase